MKTMIISAFPGVGKSFATKNLADVNCLDSDSSLYSWIYDENGNKTSERNPEFPNNYIQHIKENIGKVDVIFVSSHETVRKALKENNIAYVSVFPSHDSKDAYIERFKNRGDSEEFIKLVSDNWDKWLEDMNDIESNPALFKVVLGDDDYLTEDTLQFIFTGIDNTPDEEAEADEVDFPTEE